MSTYKCISYSGWKPWSGDHACPKCGGADIEYDAGMVLTSYPPQAQLRCKRCKHQFSSGFAAEWTNDDSLDKQWQHDQSILGTPKVGDWPPSPQIGDWPPYEPPSYPDVYIPRKNSEVGWICPKCGRCLAPHLDSCPYCNNHKRGLRASTAILDDAMDSDLVDIIAGKGIKHLDANKIDGPGIRKGE